MNPEVLPQKQLNLIADLIRLAPPETSTKEHVEATLDYLEARMETWSAEQDRRLKKAERRISLCAILQGMLSATSLDPDHTSIHHRHFSWCPFEAWMGNSIGDFDSLIGKQRD